MTDRQVSEGTAQALEFVGEFSFLDQSAGPLTQRASDAFEAMSRHRNTVEGRTPNWRANWSTERLPRSSSYTADLVGAASSAPKARNQPDQLRSPLSP
jgi:hypothetical protein